MNRVVILLAPGIALALDACVVPPPPGPSVMALPGQGKNFEAFQQDDVFCRQYAWQQTGGASPGAAASQSAVGSAVVGTALGAATGAAIGAASGAAGAGAAIGAGAGLAGWQRDRRQQRRRGIWRRPATLRHQLRPVHGGSRQHRAGRADRLCRLWVSLLSVFRRTRIRIPAITGPPLFAPSIALGLGSAAGGDGVAVGDGVVVGAAAGAGAGTAAVGVVAGTAEAGVAAGAAGAGWRRGLGRASLMSDLWHLARHGHAAHRHSTARSPHGHRRGYLS